MFLVIFRHFSHFCDREHENNLIRRDREHENNLIRRDREATTSLTIFHYLKNL